MLDDPKAKVRCACLELINLMAPRLGQGNLQLGQQQILEHLVSRVDDFTIRAVQERFMINELPYVNQDGFVETPLRAQSTAQGNRSTPEETRRQKASRQALK